MSSNHRRLLAKVLTAIAAVLLTLAAQSCASLYPVAGAATGAALGTIGGPVTAVAGAAGGAALGEALAGESRIADERDFSRDVVEQLIASASQEARDDALAQASVADKETRGTIEQLKDLLVTIARWSAGLAVIYFAGKLLISRRQKQKLVAEIESKIKENGKA